MDDGVCRWFGSLDSPYETVYYLEGFRELIKARRETMYFFVCNICMSLCVRVYVFCMYICM